jgi:hypothetical protein
MSHTMTTHSQTRIAELEARIAELEKENKELKEEKEETEDEPPKSTKNTKDNRLCVKVKYYEPYAVFKIPNGLDLEDKIVVNHWYVKYGTLHICYTNGKEKEIGWDYMSHDDFDYKRGIEGEYESGKIVSADSYDVYTDNEDSEEEDESTESTDEDSKEEHKSVWKKLTPKALKLAKQWQLDEEDLAQVTPTGANNTIKGDDLTELIEAAKKAWAEESTDEDDDEN